RTVPHDSRSLMAMTRDRALSKYSDVLAAFREARLWPASPVPGKTPKIADDAAQERIRAEVQAAFPPSRLSHWRRRLEALRYEMPRNRPLDLVGEFVEPWCVEAAESIVESNPAERERLVSLARVVSASAAEPLDDDLQSQAKLAGKELETRLAASSIPMPG